MSGEQRADAAKKRFIVRQVLIFGGLSSLLGILSVYHSHFGWHFGVDFYFVVRGLGVLFFWIACWYFVSLWMWSRTSQILADKRKEGLRRT
jgi:hypothetical protein